MFARVDVDNWDSSRKYFVYQVLRLSTDALHKWEKYQ